MGETNVGAETAEEVTKTTEQAVEDVGQIATYMHEHIPTMISFGIQVLLALAFFMLGRIVIRWIRRIVRKSFERSGADKGVQQFADQLIKFTLYFLLIFTIATKFGVDASSVAALITSAGLAVGLALQGSLSNFAGGVLILLLKPFKVGDYIIEDTNKNEGTVEEIQIFYTKLSTIDSRTIVIPNGMLTNNSIVNVTQKDERQLDLKVGISYDSDIKKAKRVLEELLKRDESVLQDMAQSVFVYQLADSSVILGVRAWVKSGEYWKAQWRLLENIKLALDDNGIEIPYPQVSVHTR